MEFLDKISMGAQTTLDQSQLLREQLIIQQSKPTSHRSYQVLPRLYPFRNEGVVIDNVLYLILYIPLIVIIKGILTLGQRLGWTSKKQALRIDFDPL